MNTDNLVKEWFYRLPNGYAVAPYSNDELKVLNDVLSENGITLNNHDREHYHTIQEHTTPANTLITLLKTTIIPEDSILYMIRIAESTSVKDDIFNCLKVRNFSESAINDIYLRAVEYDSYKQLHAVLTQSDIGVNFDKLHNYGNLVPIFEQIGFTKDFSEWLFNYRVSEGGKNVGAGENILRIIINNAYVPAKGDIGIGDIVLEVKSSQTKSSSARLRGQSGYGIGTDISSHVFNRINEIYEVNNCIPDDFPDVTNDNRTQLYYKSGNTSLADGYFIDLLERNFINRDEIVQIYATGLRKMFKLYKGNLITEVLEPSINENGIVNVNKFLPRLAAVEFKYYSQLEDWDMLMSINHKKDYYILHRDMPIHEISEIFSTHFNIDAPNTKPKATTQDSLTGVQLRELQEMS